VTIVGFEFLTPSEHRKFCRHFTLIPLLHPNPNATSKNPQEAVEQNMNMYLKLARGIRVARILVRVHQLGLQKPETRPTDSKSRNRNSLRENNNRRR